MDHTAVNEMLAAARRSGLDHRTVAIIEETVRIARVEEELRAQFPDRLLRAASAAAKVLGEEHGWIWLRRRNRILGAVPLDEIRAADDGLARVEQLLGRLDYGVYT